jgi:adenylate cyclase
VGLGIVYALAPKTFSADAPFRPVPWVLAAYLAFTLLRLVLAHRHRLPQWLRFASVVIDMALLLGLIFSFHLQYQQPLVLPQGADTALRVHLHRAPHQFRRAQRLLTAGLIAAALDRARRL